MICRLIDMKVSTFVSLITQASINKSLRTYIVEYWKILIERLLFTFIDSKKRKKQINSMKQFTPCNIRNLLSNYIKFIGNANGKEFSTECIFSRSTRYYSSNSCSVYLQGPLNPASDKCRVIRTRLYSPLFCTIRNI